MKFIPYVSVILLCTYLFTSCKKDNEPDEKEEDITLNKPHLNQILQYGTLVDIDGNNYATIQIGTQTWMAENLKTSKYNDGTEILTGINNEGWGLAKTGIYAIYDNSSANNTLYGKLYNWYAVNTGKLCPKGWHVPAESEWLKLDAYLGKYDLSGSKLKSISSLWKAPNTGATNSSGFSAIPAGTRSSLGTYMMINEYAFFWSSESFDDSEAIRSFLVYDSDFFIVGGFTDNKNDGFSCRCLKD